MSIFFAFIYLFYLFIFDYVLFSTNKLFSSIFTIADRSLFLKGQSHQDLVLLENPMKVLV